MNSSNSRIGIIYSSKYSLYDLGEGHPFRGDRFTNAFHYLKDRGIFDLENIRLLEPKPISKEDLFLVHTGDYVEKIFRLAEESRRYDLDTPVNPNILSAAMLIAGGSIRAGVEVFSRDLSKAIALGGGFHHAGRDFGGGFCLFNDVALLVEYLRRSDSLRRALIVDYDVHFGNGTSDIYYGDPNVLFISLHQDPRTIFPGKGFLNEIGEGEGKGFNVNVPLPPGTGDAAYLYALREILFPLAEEFKPEIIVANGGSDAHFADSLGSLRLTTEGFYNIAVILSEVAEKVCKGKLVLILGSGYNPLILPKCWYALSAGVIGLKKPTVKEEYPIPREIPQIFNEVRTVISRLKLLLSKYWACFK